MRLFLFILLFPLNLIGQCEEIPFNGQAHYIFYNDDWREIRTNWADSYINVGYVSIAPDSVQIVYTRDSRETRVYSTLNIESKIYITAFGWIEIGSKEIIITNNKEGFKDYYFRLNK